MTWSEVYNPDMHDNFKTGGFSEQIGQSNPFVRILVDQTKEEMTNKDTQSGNKGIQSQCLCSEQILHDC